MTTIQRITLARAVFTANAALTILYVTSDGQCFTRSLDASGHARDLSGNPNDYFAYLKTSNTIVDAITASTSSGEVDTALGVSTDTTLTQYANEKKADLAEAARVTATAAYVAISTDAVALNLLRHGETNSSILSAITARITAIS